MTSVTQKIRRFTGGISDQPDEQKLPGQVRDALNATPDVVYGLLKRPGTNYIPWKNTFADSNPDKSGKWFWVNRETPTGVVQFVGQIDNVTGKVRIWSTSGEEQIVRYSPRIEFNNTRNFVGIDNCTGQPGTVTYGDNEPYFITDNIDDLQTITVNDYTLITNRKVPVSMSRQEHANRNPEAFYEIRTLAGKQKYTIKFDKVLPDIVDEAVRVNIIERDQVGEVSTDPASYPKEFQLSLPSVPGTNIGGLKVQIRQSLTQFNGENFISEECIVLDGGEGFAEGFISPLLPSTGSLNGFRYVLRVEESKTTNKLEPIEEIVDEKDEPGQASFKTGDTVREPDVILEALKGQIDGKAGFTCEIIGNGLYITREESFSISVDVGSLVRVLSPTAYEVPIPDTCPVETNTFYVATAADVTELPSQCKEGFVALVSNLQDNQFDDTYRVFEGDNFADGPGVWGETVQPGIPNTFNTESMPHAIVYDVNKKQFLVGGISYQPRRVGDEVTVQRPSFAPEVGKILGRPINNILFYRNRLVFLTGESIVLSVVDDPFNFWVTTAETSSQSDRIDLNVDSDNPSTLFDAIENNTGLILFGDNCQYLLTNGDTGALTPATAQISRLSTYNFNRNSNPVSLGTTTGFVANKGKYTRFYEMASIRREGEPDVVEQSKVVERLIPAGLNYVAISKENDLVALTKFDADEVWLFRYFDNGEQRQQSSWFRWNFHGKIVSHVIFFDTYYLLLEGPDGEVHLVSCNLRSLSQPTTTFTFDTEDYKNIEGDSYRFFLEYAKPFYNGNVVTKTSVKKGVATTTVDKTEFNITDYPVFEDLLDKLVALDLNVQEDADGRYQGNILVPKISDDRTTITLPGEFPAGIALGYTYEMNVVMPQFYVTKAANQNSIESLDTANLIVHRVKLNLGPIGYYETTLKRLGRNDYTQVYEAKPMDLYQADELGWLPDYEQTTPVYQRNNTFNLIIKSEHPSPAALYSATLEGVYTENYYKRV